MIGILVLIGTLIFLIANVSAFVKLLAKKWGIVEWVQLRAPTVIAKMAKCDFCMSFWVGEALCFVVYLLTGGWGWLIVPVVTAPITRILL